MNADKLQRMANQIAAHFDYGAHNAHSVADPADQLLRSQTPKMRHELAHAHASGTVELFEIAALALDTASRRAAAPKVSGTVGDAG